MKRIIVCGSNSLLLAGLVSTLDRQPQLNVVGSFDRADSLFSLEDYRADVLLLEQTPPPDWWRLSQWLSATNFEIASILLTDSLTTDEVGEYLDLGFLGFLPRSIDADEIIIAINTVLTGLIVIHPELAFFRENPAITPLPQSQVELTPREAEIIQLLGTGMDNKAIASRLQISKHTVKFHVSSILTKLDASSRTEAVTLGLKQGLIRL